jgi:hypothetical protein
LYLIAKLKIAKPQEDLDLKQVLVMPIVGGGKNFFAAACMFISVHVRFETI